VERDFSGALLGRQWLAAAVHGGSYRDCHTSANGSGQILPAAAHVGSDGHYRISCRYSRCRARCIRGRAGTDTLETLLASRLTDRAILFGKLAACLAYGWLLSIITVALGIITVNAANWKGHVLLYRDAATWLALLLLPLLFGGALASAGVFVSLHAATVRQAQQTLIFAVSLSVLAIGFGIPALPQNVKMWFAETLAAWSAAEVVLAAGAVVLAVDVVLVLFALARFQRSKLVLD
jgi:ABC-2 type transport system permease protein